MNQNQLVAQQVRVSEWTRIIQDRAASGMTVTEYCKQSGFSETAYYYWLRKVRKAALTSTGVEFVELKEPENTPAFPDSSISGINFTAEATISAGILLININSKTPRELIRTLMEMAAHVVLRSFILQGNAGCWVHRSPAWYRRSGKSCKVQI